MKDAKHCLSRREFLKITSLGIGGAMLAACQPQVAPVAPAASEEGAAAPAPASKEKVTVHATGYGEVAQWEFTRKLAAEKLPEINFILDENPWGNSGWDSYADNVVTRIAGGEKLDVVGIAIEGMPLLAHKNVIAPLEPFIDADPEAKADIEKDFHPTVTKVLQYEGRQMLMAQGWNNMMIWYNPALFEKKGVPLPTENWTWDDFLAACVKLADVKGTEDDVYAYSFWDSAFGMAPWYFNNDTSWLTKDWKDSNLLDPKVEETVQFLADLLRVHKVSPDPVGWDEGAQFHAGHLAMRGCGSWCRTAAKEAGFAGYGLQYFPHKSGPLKTVVGMGGFGVTTSSEHPSEAWEVVKLMVSYEQQLDRADANEVPARRSVAESDKFLKSFPAADGRVFYKSLDYADVVPSPPNFNIVDPLLKRYYAKIWNGEMQVKEALQAAHTELQGEMDRLKTES